MEKEIKKGNLMKKSGQNKKSLPTFEQIKLRAFQIHREKGGKNSEIDNWLKAERELLNYSRSQ